ncbi:hypothetical protein [Pantoea sp. BAV 3049]|uniref:hypothetical protein n=1 Tax=Pantoea sp. BAV 3049 TaxID=2654188 RepID=UPI00131CE8D1|nr:hypothetical protein [Pantoea sp. BAV 3049]
MLTDFSTPSEGFWLYYPSRKCYSSVLRCFIEWLLELNQGGEELSPTTEWWPEV